MIEVVTNNLKPKCKHKFIFIGLREHFEEYDLAQILKNTTDGNLEIVKLGGMTQGAPCSILAAGKYIDNKDDLLIANADQYMEFNINEFIEEARKDEKDGYIMTFCATHPKWSYVRLGKDGTVLETAEKKVISNHATAGLYYFARGEDCLRACETMIMKDIRTKGDFYLCPAYNEMILNDKIIKTCSIAQEKMNGLGNPEDLGAFNEKLNLKLVTI
jgi:dTDP-glucose pyrophosphorylase